MSKIGGTAGTSQINLSGNATVALVPFAEDFDDLRDVLNVRWFGAKGDGSTDDTAALQAALDAGAGKSVYVPAGEYITTDALTLSSGTILFGDGPSSIIKSNSLPFASPGGHRQLHCVSISDFVIRDLCFDASGMTSFSGGMRSIYLNGCSNYHITRCKIITPGGVTASLQCHTYWITDNLIDIVSQDGQAKHDGIIDQWDGSNNFVIRGNIIRGNDIGKYGILGTGTDTSNNPTPMYDMIVTENIVEGVTEYGIWFNGRSGGHSRLTISNNIVKDSPDAVGIGVYDAVDFSVTFNKIDTVAVGIRCMSEPGAGGVLSAQRGVISGNVIRDANPNMVSEILNGSAIVFFYDSADCIISENHVIGSTHVYALYLGEDTARNVVADNRFDAGVTGKIGNAGNAPNYLGGGTYTPTVVGTANVSSVTVLASTYSVRDGFVDVYFGVGIQPTTGNNTTTSIGISLPIPATFTNANDVQGTASTAFGQIAGMSADTTNHRAVLQFPSPGTSTYVFRGTFRYIL